jgi:hypothetical protein
MVTDFLYIYATNTVLCFFFLQKLQTIILCNKFKQKQKKLSSECIKKFINILPLAQHLTSATVCEVLVPLLSTYSAFFSTMNIYSVFIITSPSLAVITAVHNLQSSCRTNLLGQYCNLRAKTCHWTTYNSTSVKPDLKF